MKNYNSFAPYYDSAMGDQKEIAFSIHKLIKRYAPNGQTLLELGCGSGSLLAVLSRHYQCCGMDLSSEMIKIARRKVPGAYFEVGDFTKKRLPRRFDVLLCAFDTINHLPRFSQWQQLFKKAHQQMTSNGVFIFDINTEAKIKRYSEEPPYVEVGSSEVTIFDVVCDQLPRYQLDVKVFKKQVRNSYLLHQMVVMGAAYPLSRIKAELCKFFAQVIIVDPEKRKASRKSEELYFICKKPK